MTVEGLLEGDFDLESQAIEADNVQGGQGQVRAHRQDGDALRMEYDDEADEDADGAPQQVGGPEAEGHTLLAIGGAGRFLELAGIFQQGREFDLLPILCGLPLGRAAGWAAGRRREGSYAVAFDARHQVISVGQQPANYFAARIAGVGHEVERLLESQ
jgi:hypothetical protein